jgi:hypothetical protein
MAPPRSAQHVVDPIGVAMATEADARDGIEITSWVLLAAATVGSAWCAYQASLWNGDQMRALSRADIVQFASSRAMSIVNRDAMVDVGTYLNYVGADLRGDAKLAAFLRAHARPEFKPALEAWIAKGASARAELPNPFALPEYRIAQLQNVTNLDNQAHAAIETANAANSNSDGYVLHTVLFALSLFFLGGTSELRRRGMRRAMLVLGSLVFLLTVISVARLPMAHAALTVHRTAAPISR